MGALSGFFDAQTSALSAVKTATQDRVRKNAGARLQQRDYGGAANELYGAGMLDEGSDTQNFGDAQQDRTKTAEAAKVKERASVLTQVARGLKEVPAGQRKAQLDRIAPIFGKVGLDTAMLADLTEDQLDDASLEAFAGEVERNLQFFEGNDGIYSANKATGEVKRAHAIPPKKEPRWVERTLPDGSTEWFDINAASGGGAPGPAAAPTSAPSAGGSDALFEALIMQESGGRPGVTGPQTNYGRAQGMTQMLPATAKEMAGKLGVPYRPDLMTGTTPEAADYQRKLGRAYFDEGMEKYGGDPEKALKHYHGGPDEKLWGPKTENYARSVLARAGTGAALMGGPKEDALTNPAPGAPGTIKGSAPKRLRQVENASPEELRAAGYPPGTRAQIDRVTGELKNIKQPPEAQTKATGYTHRVLSANDRLNALADRGIFKMSANTIVSEKNGVTRLVLSKPEDRQFVQASKEWLAPILRKDTGAAVTDQELLTYMDIYIPRPEDDVQTIRQKAAARQDAMIALSQETGGMYGATYGDRKFVSKMPGEKKAGGKPAPKAAAPGGKRLSPAEAAKLPSGTKFIGQDGVERTRK